MSDTLALGQPAEDVKTPNDEDQRFWSVTTVIGALDKPALMYWAAEEAAKAALASMRSLPARVEEEGEEAVIKWLRDARFRRPKDRLSATALGTAFHKATEEYALTGIRPDADHLGEIVNQLGRRGFDGTAAEVAVLNQMLDQFDGWLQRATPEYMATEVCVMSPTYGVAGTADGFFRLDGVPLIFDIKTSREQFDSRGDQKTPYPEVALQLAAYRHAEIAAVWRPRRFERFRRRYYLASPEEIAMGVPVPEVEGGVCIHVTPGSCEAYAIRCGADVHRAFLYVLEAARWQFDESKTAVGDPLVFPGGS